MNEAVKLQEGCVNGFVDALCRESAKYLIWSFKEGDVPKKVSLYVSAYKVARKRFSFLTLMRGAEGRGVLWRFLSVAVSSLFHPDGGVREFLRNLDIEASQKGGF